MHERPDPGALDKLKTRIQALRAKTIDNGCTEDEALAAAAKVAELLDRYDLSLTDVEMRAAPCERREFETHRKKRIPLDDCIGAVAHFCDCRGLAREEPGGRGPIRASSGCGGCRGGALSDRADRRRGPHRTRPLQDQPGYLRFRHQERHLANASFALGMVASIADKLTAMKAARDEVNASSGRALVVLKAAVVDAELAKLDLKLRTRRSASRLVSMSAYEAGGVAGASLGHQPRNWGAAGKSGRSGRLDRPRGLLQCNVPDIAPTIAIIAIGAVSPGSVGGASGTWDVPGLAGSRGSGWWQADGR